MLLMPRPPDAAAGAAADDSAADGADLLWPEGWELAEKPGARWFARGRGKLGTTYNHLPKAGGYFVRTLLNASVPAARLHIETEFQKLESDDAKRFTIGSVRNPCEYYVSLYSYGAGGAGDLKNKLLKQGGLKFADVYKPNSKEHFRKWLALMRVSANASYNAGLSDPSSWWFGLESMRFAQSYIVDPVLTNLSWAPVWNTRHHHQNPISRDEFSGFESAFAGFKASSVDCWVKTENIVEDTRKCLSRYKRETGGQVNWTAFDDMVNATDHNPSVHMPCSEFFDNETEALVRGADRHIFRLFDYKQCCVH